MAIVILLNPSAAQGRADRKRTSLEAALKRTGLAFNLVVTQSEDHLRRLARDAVRLGLPAVAAGGDSTFHILVNETLGMGGTGPLGMIGLGSSNDIPRAFGLDGIDRACAALAAGRVRKIDLGAIIEADRPLLRFVGQANLGLGVFVNRHVARLALRSRRRARFQTLAGLRGVLRAHRRGDVPLNLTIESEGERIEGDLTVAVFSNTRYWATGRIIAPEAVPDDGRLDACLIGPRRVLDLGRVYRRARRGLHGQAGGVRFLKGMSFKVRSALPFEIQADGEIACRPDGTTDFREAEFRVLPKALKIFA